MWAEGRGTSTPLDSRLSNTLAKGLWVQSEALFKASKISSYVVLSASQVLWTIEKQNSPHFTSSETEACKGEVALPSQACVTTEPCYTFRVCLGWGGRGRSFPEQVRWLLFTELPLKEDCWNGQF